MKFLYPLLIFLPVTIIGEIAGFSDTILFICSSLAIVPLAGLMGKSTEAISVYCGQKIGGLFENLLFRLPGGDQDLHGFLSRRRKDSAAFLRGYSAGIGPARFLGEHADPIRTGLNAGKRFFRTLHGIDLHKHQCISP